LNENLEKSDETLRKDLINSLESLEQAELRYLSIIMEEEAAYNRAYLDQELSAILDD
jgi:hypothetical protein